MTFASPPQRPPQSSLPARRPRGSQLLTSPWNLLLLVPLFTLFTPLYNRVEPTMFGMPFFYWFQLASILVGVVVTSVAYIMTKQDEFVVTGLPDRLNVDVLDEGAGR